MLNDGSDHDQGLVPVTCECGAPGWLYGGTPVPTPGNYACPAHDDMCSDVRRVSRGRHPPGNGSGLNHGSVFTVGGMAGPAEMSSPNEQSLGPRTPGGPGEIFAAQLIAVIDFLKVKFLEIFQRVRLSF